MTLTHRCAANLRKEILAGGLRVPDGLITERFLCKRLKVSRVTVRRCLALLHEEQLLRSIPSKGYVLGPAAMAHQSKQSAPGSQNLLLYVSTPNPSLVDHELGPIWDGAREEAQRRGLKLEPCRMPLKELVRAVKTSFRPRLRGVILDWYDREVAEALQAEGLPVVTSESCQEGTRLDGVIQDDAGAAEQAVARLWELGHRRMGLLVLSQPLYHPLQRRAAFAAALLRRGVVEPEWVGTSTRYDAEGGREALLQLLRRAQPPTALVLGHLEMAAGVFDELAALGLRIGREISVVAWGTPTTQRICLAGTPWADLPLDLIEWPREEMGRLLVRVLEARRASPLLPPLRVQVPTVLKVRGSSVEVRE